ncbi:MAG: hypothetical protein R3F39_19895 [Myxococcota bacterium]
MMSTLLIPCLVALAALLALAWLARQHGPGEPPPQPPDAVRRRRRVQVAALLVTSLALRAWLMATLDPDRSELWALNAANGVFGAYFHDQIELRHALHPPLHLLALYGWSALGAKLGVGGEIAWLRLPDLLLHAMLIIALLRAGTALSGYGAGFAAALLAAFAPNAVLLSTLQANYFMEAALTAWFLASLAAYLAWDRPTWVSLVLSGAAALWVGHLSLLVIAPGALLFVVTALTRRQRAAAALTLVGATALYLPLVSTLVVALRAYRGATEAAQTGADRFAAEAASLARFGEPALYVTNGFARGDSWALPGALTDSLTGFDGLATLCLLASLALLARRYPGLALAALASIVAFAASGSLLLMRYSNYAALLPLLLLVLATGAGSLPGRVAGHPRATVAPLAFAALALAALYLGNPRPTLHRPFTAFDGWSFYGRELGRVIDHMSADAAPILAMDDVKIDWFYGLCSDRSSLTALSTCHARHGSPELAGAFERFTVSGRTLAAPSGARGEGPHDDRCARIDELLSAPPFLGAPFWLVVGDSYLQQVPLMPGCPPVLYAHLDACPLVLRVRGLALHRCERPVTFNDSPGSASPVPLR